MTRRFERRVKITILVDDQAAAGLNAEHGFSLWIETARGRILFDTGAGGTLVSNAAALGADLGLAGAIVLSHGHYDHTGGLAQALGRAPQAHVYCHPAIARPRWSLRGGAPKQAQMTADSLAALRDLPAHQLHWTEKPAAPPGPAAGITGFIPRETDFEDTGGPFFLDAEGRRADPLEDDQALWLETEEGLVVCAGCCHAGIVNTLQYILRLNPGSKIRAVIGGFHLLHESGDRLRRTAEFLRTLRLDLVVPCHCTGKEAVRALAAGLDARVSAGAAGSDYVF